MESKKVWRRITIFLVVFLGWACFISWLMLKDDIITFIKCVLMIMACAAVTTCIIGYMLIKMGRHARSYTASTTGIFTGVKTFPMSDNVIGYYFQYEVDGEEFNVSTSEADCVCDRTPIGTEVTIWYNPEEPGVIIASDDITRYGSSRNAWLLFLGSAVVIVLGIVSFITL